MSKHMPTNSNHNSLIEILQRSQELDVAITDLLDPETYRTFDDSERMTASFAACSVSLEHARGLRMLLHEGLPTSAVSLMRPQYEALTRSVWLLYAASDTAVEKLQTPLTLASEKSANGLPSLSDMLGAIDGKAPPAATQMLTQFKDVTWRALNSFIHGGIHPLQRHIEGYPSPLLIDIVRNSNGLLTASGMMLAILSGNSDIAKRMSKIQYAFLDCLPIEAAYNNRGRTDF